MGIFQKTRIFHKSSYVVFCAALGLASSGMGQEGNVNPLNQETSKTSNSHSEEPTEKTPAAIQRRLASSARDLNQDRQVEERLQAQVDLQLDQMPLDGLFKYLRDRYSLQCVLDHSAVDDLLSPSTLLSCDLTGVRLETALEVVLREHNATFSVDNGLIRIISKDVARNSEYFSTRIIDCRNLLEKMPEPTDLKISSDANIRLIFSETAKWNFNKPVAAAQGNLLTLKPVLTTEASQEELTQQDEQGLSLNLVATPVTREDALMSAITGVIAPEDWSHTRGEGTIQFVGGIMVISQRRDIIRKVENLLSQLESHLN
jgi:hypothetical protein